MKIKESSIVDSYIHESVEIINPTNIYGATIGMDSFISPFVEIQKGAVIGKNTRISSHTFICEGVCIGDECFIAHGVMFTNDLFESNHYKDWDLKKTNIGNNVRIGANATILPVNIADNAIIGAGAVVTRDVPENAIIVGNPGRVLRYRDD